MKKAKALVESSAQSDDNSRLPTLQAVDGSDDPKFSRFNQISPTPNRRATNLPLTMNPDIGSDLKLEDIEAYQYNNAGIIVSTPGKISNEILGGYEKTLPKPLKDSNRLEETNKKLIMFEEQPAMLTKFTPSQKMAYHI